VDPMTRGVCGGGGGGGGGGGNTHLVIEFLSKSKKGNVRRALLGRKYFLCIVTATAKKPMN
jgi:hypothetical protein